MQNVVRSLLSAGGPYYLSSKQQRCWSDCVDAQADLHLCCSQMAWTVFLMMWLIYSQKSWVHRQSDLTVFTSWATSLVFLQHFKKGKSKTLKGHNDFRWKSLSFIKTKARWMRRYFALSVVSIIFHQKPFFRLWYKDIWAAAWQNQQNDLYTRQRLRSAWASTQSDQSLRCPQEETLGP